MVQIKVNIQNEYFNYLKSVILIVYLWSYGSFYWDCVLRIYETIDEFYNSNRYFYYSALLIIFMNFTAYIAKSEQNAQKTADTKNAAPKSLPKN